MFALQEARKLHTPAGQAALVLARRLDNSHSDTLAGIASGQKRLQDAIAALIAEVPPENDAVDELRERRDRKQVAASG
jgi:hypothetical protein